MLPIVTYAIPVYTMAELHGGADRVALFFCGAAVFAATIGLLSMALTIGTPPSDTGLMTNHTLVPSTIHRPS